MFYEAFRGRFVAGLFIGFVCPGSYPSVPRFSKGVGLYQWFSRWPSWTPCGVWKALGGPGEKMGKSLERSGGVDLVFA